MRHAKRLCSWLLALVLMIGMLPIDSVYAVEAAPTSGTTNAAHVKNDPFGAMYDSDELFLNEADGILAQETQMEENSAPAAAEAAPLLSSMQALEPALSVQPEETPEISSQSLLDMMEEGDTKSLDVLPLEDETLHNIQALYESNRTDRFLIKYKENGDHNVIEQNSRVAEVSAVTERAVPASDAASVSAEAKTDERVELDSNRVELIVLDDKVNPKDFAEELEDAGLADEIEYIQPDFLLSYQGLELTLEEDTASLGEDPALEPDASEAPVDPIQAADPVQETPVQEEPVQEQPVQETPVQETPVQEELPALEDLLPEKAEQQITGQETIVALIDTGVDLTHPDLMDTRWKNPNEVADDGIDNDGNGYVDDTEGWNFYDDSNSLYDSSSPLQSAHGTHIAGIIQSVNEDSNVKIMPLKVFGDNGAYTSDIIDAIHYAEANGARIVNCSFGSTDDNPALKDAIENSDMLFVCSVGNARSDLNETPIYPACFDLDNVISVTSTNADGGLSYFSNYSPDLVDVAALGRDVSSTLPGGEYGLQSGTSMSAAQVSGVAAAVLSVQNDLDAASLKQRLVHTSDLLSNLQNDVKDGRQINLQNAVQNLEQTAILENDPEDDFDVHGYQRTEAESWELFSQGTVVQVAVGDYYSMALMNDGTVWAWGKNLLAQLGDGTTTDHGAPVQVIGLSGIVAIATGYAHSLAVDSSGNLWAWGNNEYGQLGNGTRTQCSIPVQVNGLTDVIAVEAGRHHSLAVKSDGTVWAWGHNYSGELGDGTTTDRRTPVQVSGLTNVIAVAAGYDHSLAVKSDGTVWAWGYNSYGQLGDGTTTDRSTPAQVSGLTEVIAVAAGLYHSLTVKSDGTVWAWGYNYYGQLGDGTTTFRSSTPVQVSGLSGIIFISAGSFYSLAVDSGGNLWSWGDNGYGQLGDGTTTKRSTPVQVGDLSGIVAIAGGYNHGLAADGRGSIWSWGDNEYGELGDGATMFCPIAAQVDILSSIVSISVGGNHSLALDSSGNVWAWGYNNNAQLGDGTRTNRSVPVQVSRLSNIVAISSGYDHSLALDSGGNVWAWGNNIYGQLGDGTTIGPTKPVQVSSLRNIVAIVGISYHSLALDSSGNVWAWGYNNYGQLGDGTTTKRSTPVQVSSLSNIVAISGGTYHSLTLDNYGNIWAWGYNNYGQLGDGTTTNRSTPVQVNGLSNIVVAAGNSHHLAVGSGGGVWAWGNNNSGQLGDGTRTNRSVPVQVSGLSNIVAVAGGSIHSLAVDCDGKVLAWGNNNRGQLGDGTTVTRSTPVQVSGLSDIVAVAGGASHSLALDSSGNVWAWGNNQYGQLGLGRLLQTSTPIRVAMPTSAPATLAFSTAPYSLALPTSGTATLPVSAAAHDTDGNEITGAEITYALSTPYAGVTINAQTGLVTVSSTALPGEVTVVASCGTLTATTVITLTAAAAQSSLDFQASSYSLALPQSGAATLAVNAIAKDAAGNVLENAEITYALSTPYAGVTIDAQTGLLTVSSSASPGDVTIAASYGQATATTVFTLTMAENLPRELALELTQGSDIHVSLKALGVSSLNGQSISVHYDPQKLQLSDFAAQTYQKDTVVGVVDGTYLTVLSHENGVITLQCTREIPSGKNWSGVITILRFDVLQSGTSTITAASMGN